MKTKLMIAAGSALLVTAACTDAKFQNGSGKRKGGAVVPSNGMVNPAEEPLDISELDENRRKREDGGPTAGTGEVLSKTIELTCDNSSGVIVDVGGPGSSSDGSGGGDGKDGGDDANTGAKLMLGGPEVEIGKDGKPIGDDGKGGDDGAGGGDGKGEEPLPPAPPIETPEKANVTARVKGQFCPTAQNTLTVLFVVDFSGSMGSHYPGVGEPLHPGYDPQVSGSCGRMRAAQAILGKIKSARKNGDKVLVGMVPFAGGIVTEKLLKMVDAEEFEVQVNKDSFCQYVIQHPSFGIDPQNPGGMQSPGIDSSTNYTAAFTAAKSLLSGMYGRKEVFFLTDGEPTSGGADPVQAGIDAGADLRASVDNLTLNALILGEPPASAEQVLVGVAGSQDRVRKAANADELAEQIMTFPEASIDESTGKATLTIPPYEPEADVALRYLSRDSQQPGVWIYETQPFVLLGKPGEEVLHTVTVTAKGADGSTHQSTVKIRYRQ